MSDFQKSIIAPETVAAQLAAAANLSAPDLADSIRREPRYVELLWFIQWLSAQPGSLKKAAVDIVAQLPENFGLACLRKTASALTADDCRKIWEELEPTGAFYSLVPTEKWEDSPGSSRGDFSFRGRRLTPAEERRLAALLSKLKPEQFRELYLEIARTELPKHLRGVAENTRIGQKGVPICFHRHLAAAGESPFWCSDLPGLLFQVMESHAAAAAPDLAPTEVVTQVFETLDYAWHSKTLVQIQGNSRFGKTESVKAWCAKYPGRVRLVSTPSSNYEKDLYIAIAQALGIQTRASDTSTRLKSRIDHVIRNCNLMFIFDEAHFLLPQRVFRETQPARLNYVRTAIIDSGLPVALVTTPQAFNHAVNKFVRFTGYNFEQFLGRIAHTAALPETLSQADLMAIAKVHCPGLAAPLQKFVVAKALQKESYIKAVENIISLARWIAARAGRDEIQFADLELAASDRMRPLADAPPASRPVAAIEPSAPLAIARPRHPRRAQLSAPARSITPETQPA